MFGLKDVEFNCATMHDSTFKGFTFHSLSRKDGDIILDTPNFFLTLYKHCEYAYNHTELMDVDEFHKTLDPDLMRMALKICIEIKKVTGDFFGNFSKCAEYFPKELGEITEKVVLQETGWKSGVSKD